MFLNSRGFKRLCRSYGCDHRDSCIGVPETVRCCTIGFFEENILKTLDLMGKNEHLIKYNEPAVVGGYFIG